MARKPKAAPVTDVAQAAAGADLALTDDAPAPVRRGRKPKAAAATPEPETTAKSSNAMRRTAAADAAVPDEEDEPIRARRGRRPKPLIDDAAAFLPQDHVQEQPEESVDQLETVQPIPDEGEMLMAGADVHGADVESSGTSSGDVGPDKSAEGAVPLPPGLAGEARGEPAAHWDRVTDAVQFDWSEIERTASQEGPNQAMAKLLIAARAEGANSRWPL